MDTLHVHRAVCGREHLDRSVIHLFAGPYVTVGAGAVRYPKGASNCWRSSRCGAGGSSAARRQEPCGRWAVTWAGHGAHLIGGCCGTGPEHIALLAARLARAAG